MTFKLSSLHFSAVLTVLGLCLVHSSLPAHAAEGAAPSAPRPVVTAGSAAQANRVPGTVLDMVLASVDGEPVTLSDLRRYIVSQGGTPPSDVQSGDFEIRKQLRELVVDNLLRKEAKEAGIVVESEEIEAYINEIKKQNSVDDAGFEQILAGRGLTREEYSNQVRGDIMRARILSSRIRSKINILDEEIERYLAEHPELVPARGSVHVQQVLIKVGPDGADADRETITAIRQALDEGRSMAEAGGDYFQDLGFVSVADLRDELQPVIKALKPGEVSSVVETPLGLHLIKVISRNDSKGSEIDPTVKSQVRERLFQARYREEVDKFLNDELPKKYHVELKL